MAARREIGEASHGQASIDDLLDIRGFHLNANLEIEPDFLSDVEHEHGDDLTSFVFRESRQRADRPLAGVADAGLALHGMSARPGRGVSVLQAGG
jgi:G3E family GTPase